MRLCERGARLKEQIQKSGEGMERAIVLLLFAQINNKLAVKYRNKNLRIVPFSLLKVWIRFPLDEWKLGTICDHKASWDCLEKQHEGHWQTWRAASAVFLAALIVSDIQINFYFYRIPQDPHAPVLCVLFGWNIFFSQNNLLWVFNRWLVAVRHLFAVPLNDPLAPLWS